MELVFPQLLRFDDVALLLLRLIVAAVFFESGRRHASDPVGRNASIGLILGATWILGWAEMVAALAVMLGVFTQLAALVLMLVMLGPPEEGVRVAHRFLGGEHVGVALRSAVPGPQSGDPDDRRRSPRPRLTVPVITDTNVQWMNLAHSHTFG